MRILVRWLPACAAIAICAGFISSAGAAVAGPTFSVKPQTQTVNLSDGTIQLQVVVPSPQNVGSFQFLLRYDPGVLTPESAEASPFIGSSGRQVNCFAPIIDGEDGPGTFKFGCATLGSEPGASASAETSLATVTFHLAGGAQTSVLLEKDTLSDPSGLPLCVANPGVPPAHEDYANTCPVQNGTVNVTGGDAGQQHGLAPTPTPIAVDTSSDSGGVGAATPSSGGLGSVPTTTGASGGAVHPLPSGGVGVVASAPESGSAAGNATGNKVGRFGYGTATQGNDNARGAGLIALLLGAGGVSLLLGAARIRRQEARAAAHGSHDEHSGSRRRSPDTHRLGES